MGSRGFGPENWGNKGRMGSDRVLTSTTTLKKNAVLVSDGQGGVISAPFPFNNDFPPNRALYSDSRGEMQAQAAIEITDVGETRFQQGVQFSSDEVDFSGQPRGGGIYLDSTANKRLKTTDAFVFDNATDKLMEVETDDLLANQSVKLIQSDQLPAAAAAWTEQTVPSEYLWTPENLPGLEFWLDASEPSTLQLDGVNKVVAWYDRTAFIEGSAPESNRPTYDATANGGRGGVVFDQSGADKEWLDFGDILKSTNATGLTVMGVFKAVDPTSGGILISKYGSPAGSLNRWRLQTNPISDTEFRCGFVYGQLNLVTSSPFVYDPSDFFITGGVYDNGSASDITCSVNGQVGINPLSVSPDDTPIPRTVLLARTHGGDFTDIICCEIIAFLRPLSEFERQACEGYLAHKWGTVAFLPADHPFKVAPPGYIESISSIAYSPKLRCFAAVATTGVGNRVLIGSQGVWAPPPLFVSPDDPNQAWRCIAWGQPESFDFFGGVTAFQGAFVAVSPTGILHSTNGAQWSVYPPISSGDIYTDIIYAGAPLQRFYSVATSVTQAVASSLNGVTWVRQTTPTTTTRWRSLAYSPTLGTGQGRLVAVGFNTGSSTTTDWVMFSEDGGTTWQLVPSLPVSEQSWSHVTWSPRRQRFVAVNFRTATTVISYSDDGLVWVLVDTGVLTQSNHVIWCDELNVFLITVQNGTLLSSTDGVTWAVTPLPVYAGQITQTAIGTSQIITVGTRGRVVSLPIVSGDLGITTLNPTATAHIEGSVKVSGDTTVGSLTINSTVLIPPIDETVKASLLVEGGFAIFNETPILSSSQNETLQVFQNPENSLIVGLGANGTAKLESRGEPLELSCNNASRMVFSPNGGIGVGTSTPDATFDVNGVLKSNQLSVSGTNNFIGGTLTIDSGCAVQTLAVNDFMTTGQLTVSSGPTTISGDIIQTSGNFIVERQSTDSARVVYSETLGLPTVIWRYSFPNASASVGPNRLTLFMRDTGDTGNIEAGGNTMVTFNPDFGTTFQKSVQINGPVTIGCATPGAECLRLNTERPWVFQQEGTGSNTALVLYPTTSNKRFMIQNNTLDYNVAKFTCQEIGTSSTVGFLSDSVLIDHDGTKARLAVNTLPVVVSEGIAQPVIKVATYTVTIAQGSDISQIEVPHGIPNGKTNILSLQVFEEFAQGYDPLLPHNDPLDIAGQMKLFLWDDTNFVVMGRQDVLLPVTKNIRAVFTYNKTT
jgi:hypothetical protein